MIGLLKALNDETMRENTRLHLENDILRHKGWYYFEGGLFIVLAGLVAFLPGVTALTVEVVVAVLLVLGGAFRITQGVRAKHNRWWRGITGGVYAAVGVAMLVWPALGLMALVWAIGLLLIVEGVFETSAALTLKPLKSWGWLLAAGIASLVLGMLILMASPAAGVIFIAFALALSMALYGVSLIRIAYNSKAV